MLNACIPHRFDLRKAQVRQHIVEGLLKALTDLDKVVATVRAAKDGAAASKELQSKFGLSVEQVTIVLLLQNPKSMRIVKVLSHAGFYKFMALILVNLKALI